MLNVVIAFILETFRSRMSFQRSQVEAGNDKELETLKVYLRRPEVLQYQTSLEMVHYCTLFDDEVRASSDCLALAIFSALAFTCLILSVLVCPCLLLSFQDDACSGLSTMALDVRICMTVSSCCSTKISRFGAATTRS